MKTLLNILFLIINLLFISSKSSSAFFCSNHNQRLVSTKETQDGCSEESTNIQRREFIVKWTPLLTSLICAPAFSETPSEDQDFMLIGKEEENSLTIPLKWIPSLNAYVLYFYLFGECFGAIIDTGSPFLTVPSYCDARRWGCYRPERTQDSGLGNTIEIFANNQGTVVWRKAEFSFTKSNETPVVFGVLDEKLMDGPGGVFFGLIKNTARRIRPSILGQLKNIKAFEISLRSNSINNDKENLINDEDAPGEQSSLTFFTKSVILGSNYIPLVTDLNRRYRDPVEHYTAICNSIKIDGRLVEPQKFPRTYVIFDTGVSGMVVSQTLFDERYSAARQNKEKRLWGGTVEISFETNRPGETISLQAIKPVTTPLSQAPWGPGFKANLIVMGLAFLEGHTITVDIDDQKLKIT